MSTTLAPPDSRPPQPGDVADVAGGHDDTRPLPADPPSRFSRSWWGSSLPLPTPRLAIAVGAVAVLVALVPAAWGAVLIVLAIGIVDAVLAPAPWRVPATRQIRDVIPLGEQAPLAWTIVNPSRYAVEIAIAEDPAPSLRLQHRRAASRMAPDATARMTTHLQPSRRGRFTLAHLTVRTHGPLGLASRQHRRSHVDHLEVHPAFRSRREAELRVTRGRILEVGLRSAMAQGRGTLFEALRDYTPDDEVRRVDWAATARVGRPIVRTYRAERNQNVLILLDTGRLMAGMVGDVPRLDHAMDAAMALTTVATRLGDRAGLLAFSAGVRAAVPPRGDRGQLLRVTRAMFELEPDLTESAYDEVFGVAVAQQRSRSLLVVLTELASEALAETLVPALPLLLSRHLVVVASVQDPDVEAWRTAPPADTDQAYRAAGAATVRRARDRTGDLLRQMGAIVVDAPPGGLAGRLADAYLDVKVTGRL